MATTEATNAIQQGMAQLTGKVVSMMIPVVVFVIVTGIVRIVVFTQMRKRGESKRKADLISYLVAAGMALLFIPIWGFYLINL